MGCTGRLGHAIINLPTKFEVPDFVRYVNMKGVATYRKWFNRAHIYEFLLALHSNSVPILYRIFDIAA